MARQKIMIQLVTVFPFILRGASIIGIDSVFTPIKLLPEDNSKPLEKRTWQAAIDPVGGENLPYIVKRLDNNVLH